MVLNREEAAQRAEKTTRNKAGMCQSVTRGYYGADSAGDVDHDGDADAVDGWLKENAHFRHTDRHPPRGVPVAWSGGRSGHGHRAISLGDGKIRSTDAPRSGTTSTQDLDWPERQWGLHYLGWSETIDGEMIPLPPPPPNTRISNFHGGAPRYDLRILDRAVANGRTELKPILRKIKELVAQLPNDHGNTRVKKFKQAYKSDYVLRMGILNEAVKAGRKGEVKTVRDALKRELKKIPER